MCAILFALTAFAQRGATLVGRVLDSERNPLSGALVFIEGTPKRTVTNDRGEFHFEHIRPGTIQLRASFVGFTPTEKHIHLQGHQRQEVTLVLKADHALAEVEVFGEAKKRPEKLEALTRVPLRLDEQVQSVSVISHKMITEQGTLTLGDATRNVPGVTTFAAYGGMYEGLTLRGYRGIPTLKNGVRVNSDFRGHGILSDMQGVETIQVLRGSAAIAQGIGNDLGSAAGAINIATKVPRFINRTEVGLRTGSWGQFRPTVDWQYVLSKKSALRFNAAFERRDDYNKLVDADRVYINPSFAWQPSERTQVLLEMDYLYDSRTPNQGTVNLAADSVYNIYDMPRDKFQGFSTDRITQNYTTYAARLLHDLGKGYSIRLALSGSQWTRKSLNARTSTLRTSARTGLYNLRSRSYGGSTVEDGNVSFQADFIGKDIFTGSIRHTFNIGFDYKTNNTLNEATNSVVVDTIDVLSSINNTLPAGITLTKQSESKTNSYTYGFLAQEVMTLNKYLKLSLGLRYSKINGTNNYAASTTSGDAWDPLAGIIFTPVKDINVFASYTTTTSLTQAANVDENGEKLGAQRDKQFEVGLKSEFFNNRLRFNLTLFHIKNGDLAYRALNAAGQNLPYFIKAGDIVRKGLEAELTGRLLPNMDVVLGYAYLDAQYQNSGNYYNGSAPMNAAKHTANGWLNYTVERGTLKGLGFGLGAYYVGKRPFAEYSQRTLPGHDVQPGVRPFLADAYTTVNVQASYRHKAYTIRAFFNNVFNSIGYNAYYRGGYINRTDPRNFAVSLHYTF